MPYARRVEIRGITFVGTATPDAAATIAFARDVLGLVGEPLDGLPATLFRLPDGSSFAVMETAPERATRTVGFLVADLDAAIAELHAAGVATDGIGENARWRYTHFRAPDGELYELVEERGGS